MFPAFPLPPPPPPPPPPPSPSTVVGVVNAGIDAAQRFVSGIVATADAVIQQAGQSTTSILSDGQGNQQAVSVSDPVTENAIKALAESIKSIAARVAALETRGSVGGGGMGGIDPLLLVLLLQEDGEALDTETLILIMAMGGFGGGGGFGGNNAALALALL